MKKIYLLPIIVFLLVSRHAVAQKSFNDNIKKNALQSADGYQLRTKDERYEGLYILHVGAPVLEVVAVTHGPVAYEMNPNEKLVIEVPPLKAYKTVGVSGASFGLSKNYRLDAVVNAGDRKVIPVKDVLKSNDIFGQNLGIFGHIGDPQPPTLYVPVRASARPRTGKTYEPIQITLFPRTGIEKFHCSYAKSVQGKCVTFQDGQPMGQATSTYRAQQPIVLLLPGNSGTAAGDEICLSISFKVPGDAEWHSKSLRLLLTQ